MKMSTLYEKSESCLISELKTLTLKFQNDLIHFSLEYDELVYYFHEYMRQLVNYSPLNLYDNPLSKFVKRHLGGEIPGCFLEEFQYYEEDCDFKNELCNLTKYYMDIISEGYGISDSEFLELYKLSLVEQEHSDMFVRYLLSQLVEANNITSDTVYRDLINRFVCGFIKDNDLEIDFKIGKLDKQDDDIYADSICENGRRLITFDKDHLRVKDIMFNLEDIFHEIWYTLQDSYEYNDVGTIELIKMDDYIRRIFGDSYYDENYDLISYEVDANLHAVLLLGSYLKEVSPVMYELNREKLENKVQSYSDLLYSRKRVYAGCDYDIDTLFEIALIEGGKKKEDILGHESEEKTYLKEVTFSKSVFVQ